ncbi:MAG: hypothetical protein GF384_06445 [Elusimicrobia bacterium]|nr:hypothetical protein [Elusimicrobiota bacterium]MBD3412355.1 hypothetical protein [Elusimicrobiota bacterium]
MLIRILFRNLGFSVSKPSQWNLNDRIRNRRDAVYENKDEIIKVSAVHCMITLHKLNHKPIAVNEGHIQSVESMGENSLIIFTTGNRIVVQEPAEEIFKQIEKNKSGSSFRVERIQENNQGDH